MLPTAGSRPQSYQLAQDSRSYYIGQLIGEWMCQQCHHTLLTKRSSLANTLGTRHGDYSAIHVIFDAVVVVTQITYAASS